MKRRTPLTQYALVLLALVTLLWATIPAGAQSETRSPQAQDNDVTRHQLADFDRFLDSHPEIGEQLKRDPSLVNDQKFAADHPALQQFLAEHPQVREQYKENPNTFMRQENRFDRSQDARGRDLTRPELANLDRFLAIRKSPSSSSATHRWSMTKSSPPTIRLCSNSWPSIRKFASNTKKIPTPSCGRRIASTAAKTPVAATSLGRN